MPRYFTRPKSFWVSDDIYESSPPRETPQVPDHEATNTGLLDKNGDTIWRAPRPMGFLWEFE